MITFSTKISKNFAWELTLFHKFREFKDGLSIFNIICDIDWYKGNHNPQFTFRIEILNFYPLEFRIYNIHHVEEDD